MRILVDYDRCDSTGLCTAIAPDLFSLDSTRSVLSGEPPVAVSEADGERAGGERRQTATSSTALGSSSGCQHAARCVGERASSGGISP